MRPGSEVPGPPVLRGGRMPEPLRDIMRPPEARVTPSGTVVGLTDAASKVRVSLWGGAGFAWGYAVAMTKAIGEASARMAVRLRRGMGRARGTAGRVRARGAFGAPPSATAT